MSAALAHLQLRSAALAVVVCTTGTMALAATATGYTRATGSFVTDGFMAGMEVTPTGFTQTTPAVITHVAALTLTVAGTRTVQSSGGGRSLSVTTPAVRVFENLEPTEAGVILPDLPVNRPHWIEEFVPSTQRLMTTSRRGWTESTGLYVLTWAGLANHGALHVRTSVDVVLAAFPPAHAWTLTDGAVLRVGENPAPWARQITRRPPSWAASIVTIPWTLTAQLP